MIQRVFHLLAQADQSIWRIVVWSVVLIVVLVVLFAVATKVRRWSRGAGQETTGHGFTLSDLRRMHQAGQISDEEFERARGRIAAVARNQILEQSPSSTKEGSTPPNG